MRQRLGIAAALLGDPPVLMFDEPFNGMDPEGIVWMRGFLRSLAAQGRAVLVSSHLMSELQDTADHLVVVGRGRVIADASVAELIAAASADRVTVRTAARDEAMTVLARAGAEAAATARDIITVAGMTPERVVKLLSENSVPFAELSAHRASLEEAYMELTRDAVEFRVRRPQHERDDAVPLRAAVRRDGFAQLLRAEWTKFRTVRGWVIGTGRRDAGHRGARRAHRGEQRSAAYSWARTARRWPARRPHRAGRGVGDRQLLLRPPAAGRERQHHRPGDVADRPVLHHGGFASGQNPTAGMTPGVQPWSKAGIIVKASTRQGAAYAAMMVTGGHGVRMQWDFTHDVAGLAGKVSAASPRWLRLTRSGDTITGYDSADGAHWTRVGTATLAGLPSTAQAGLFAASPGYSVTTTSLGGRILQGRPHPGHRRLRPGGPAGHLARGPVDRPGHPAGP